MSNERLNWSSSFVFIMASIGAAVGLGNIWKFPYMVGSYGGSAFVLVYLISVILVSLPLALAEIVSGKITQANPFFCYQKLFDKFSNQQNFFKNNKALKCIYKFASWLLVITPLAFAPLYSVIGGWILEYFINHSFSGFANVVVSEDSSGTFNTLIATPERGILMNSLFIILGSVIVMLGIEKGIGKANAIMVPGLFLLILFLLGFGIYYGNFDAAVDYLFAFNLEAALSGEVFFAAMAQTFFSICVGSTVLMLYGSHIKKDSKNFSKNVFSIILADTIVSILAALLVFSFLFSVDNVSIVAGPSLIFEVLPIIFAKIPLATIIAPLFSISLIFASVTSLISVLEPPIGFLLEKYPKIFKSRISATIFVAMLSIIFSSIITLSMAGKFGNNMDLFNLIDFALCGFMFPLNALFNALFFGFILTWISKKYLKPQQVIQNKKFLASTLCLSPTLFVIFEFFIKYISPVVILLIFLAGLNLI